MAGLFSTPSLPAVPVPPPVPSLSDPSVTKAAEDTTKNRRGRASTFLTDPSLQRTTNAPATSYLGGF